MNTRLTITVALCVIGTSVLLGEQITPAPTPPSQDAPVVTFRSAIDAVQIDVMVTDADGNAVSGLTVDDFELVEDGKPQPITTFEAVDIPIERREEYEETLGEPDVQSNAGPPGRVYLFALDDLDGCAALRTRRFLRQFLDEHFGPNDIAAVTLVGRGLATDGQDFTSHRRLLLNAIGKISGEAEDSKCSAPRSPKSARTGGRSQQMASLRLLIESIARIPGRHKAMLFFTHGPEIDMLDIVDYNGGVLGLAGEDAHAAMMAATRSNLRIYPIDPAGLTTDTIPLETQASMRALGHATGGFALVNSNSFTETFERIVRDNSVYYMLGFNSAYEKNNGRYVRVQVKVKRPGLTVHAREGYVAPTRDERRAKDRVKPPSSAVEAGLASPLTTSGIKMRVSAVPYRGVKRNATVALTVEIDAASLDLVSKNGVQTGEFDIRYVATDAKQKVFPEVRHKATVKIEPTSGGAASSMEGTRIRVLTGLELPQGRYQLRVAAGTASRAGNVVYDLEVPDFGDDPLTMSGFALLAPSEASVLNLQSDQIGAKGKPVTCRGGPCVTSLASIGNTSLGALDTLATESPLNGLLPGPPTTIREFAVSDRLMLVIEVYDNRRPDRGDLPQTISLTTSLRSADGRVIALTSEERASTSPQRPSGGHRFEVNLPLKDVPPGAYALEVAARSSADERVASHRIPIRVR